MTVEQFLEMKLEFYKRKHKRLSFIERCTKNKRIKKKVNINSTVAFRMIQNFEEIIQMRMGL
jgi:hypothetical protein